MRLLVSAADGLPLVLNGTGRAVRSYLTSAKIRQAVGIHPGYRRLEEFDHAGNSGI